MICWAASFTFWKISVRSRTVSLPCRGTAHSCSGMLAIGALLQSGISLSPCSPAMYAWTFCTATLHRCGDEVAEAASVEHRAAAEHPLPAAGR